MWCSPTTRSRHWPPATPDYRAGQFGDGGEQAENAPGQLPQPEVRAGGQGAEILSAGDSAGMRNGSPEPPPTLPGGIRTHQPEGFPPMSVKEITYTEKAEAGKALLDACSQMESTEPVLSAPTGALRWSCLTRLFPRSIRFPSREPYPTGVPGDGCVWQYHPAGQRS